MITECLLIIDLPDERIGRNFDHIHSWGTLTEMTILKRRLEDQFGNGHDHRLVQHCYECPLCQEQKKRRKRPSE